MNMPTRHIAFAAPLFGVYHGRPARGLGIARVERHGISSLHRQDAGGTLPLERISRP